VTEDRPKHPSANHLHLPRRLFHMASGTAIVTIGIIFFPNKREFVAALTILWIVDLGIEALRLGWPWFNRTIEKTMGNIMREGEQRRISGIAYYLLGCLISGIIFPREIANLAILFLAFGDPVASLCGVIFGKRRLPDGWEVPEKSWEGSLGCFLVCFLITLNMSFYMPRTVELEIMQRLAFCILGGLGAALGELIPLRTDDNLALPVVSGAFLWLTAAVLNLVPGFYF